MGEQPTPQPENDPSPAWLQRQWERVRQLWADDIIIGQVGERATNVIIGKNNVQINVAGRNLVLPIYGIAVALVILLGFLLYPLVEPLWNPTQMTGPFRIAVADFGEIDAQGRQRATQRGADMSKWFFDNLYSEYQSSTTDVARTIEIWHDQRADIEKNVRFGTMRGQTATDRRAAAAKLAARIGAHMVIYGNLVTEGETPQLALEFYLSPLVNDETAALVGPHRLGRPIALPVAFTTGSPDANTAVAALLKVRTDAFFWLTIGLTQDLLGRSAEALATLRLAERTLTTWEDADGKELLYFFIGRQELFLGNAAAAVENFQHALTINPTYARAQIALGSAQLRQARAVPPDKRLQAPSLLLTALDSYLKGLSLAATAQEPLVIDLANLALAKSYRLLGETYYQLHQDEQARQFFALTRQKVVQVIAPLRAARQFRLLAQAYEAEGAASLQEGVMLLEQAQFSAAQEWLIRAKNAYQHCLDQGRQTVDQVLTQQVIGAGCRPYYQITEDYLAQVNSSR